MLVNSEWLYKNMKDVKIVEVNFDPLLNYYEGHIPNAVLLKWKDLLHDHIRDFAPPEKISKVLGNLGISKNDFIVLYSDTGNRYAFYTYWLLKAYGHEYVAILDGGLYKWLKDDLPIEDKIPIIPYSEYHVDKVDWSNRILIWELL